VAKNKFSDNFKNLDLQLHGVRLPSFEIPKEEKHKIKVSEDVNNYDFLRALCLHGFKELGLKKGSKEYDEYVNRVKYELETLKELGFIDYVLLVWDVINFCKKNDIPTGPGRGSAAGSIVLYLIGVTKVDPVKYGLYFERFVSKIRAKKQVVDGITYLDGSLMCDVDLDICYYNRQRVLKYLEEKFEGRTCKIVTLLGLKTKILLKECGKIVNEIPDSEMTRVTAMVPSMYGQLMDLKEAKEEVEDLKIWCEENPDVIESALKIRGLIKAKGVHASAVSISYDSMADSCPTELTRDKDTFVSSFNMDWISQFNVKLDILGLKAVSIIDQTCKLIGIESKDIDINDPEIYRQLQDLKTPHGLFQIEADTNYKVCRDVRPQNLEQLSAVVALARPGALAFVEQYARYVETGTLADIHPFFDDILSTTGGVCLYQEQMMQMAHKVGFTLDEAEILRRIVGKKKVEEVAEWKQKIADKIKENKLDPEIGDILWSILEDSANYSFNKSHSIAYAALAASMVWLKFKHPKEFFVSLLEMSRHEQDPIKEVSTIHKEFHHFNLELHPPHIIKSKMDFSVEDNGIRFGLLSIKGISEKSMEKLNDFKDEFSNKFEIFQAAEEAGVSLSILCPLIQAGALEGFSQSRAKVAYEAQLWSVLTKTEKKFAIPLAEEYDYDLVKVVKYMTTAKTEKGKEVIKDSRLQTITKKCQKYQDIYNHNRSNESFTNWYYEKNLLGYTYGKTLFDIFSQERRGLQHIETVTNMSERTRCVFVGRVEEDPISRTSKAGNKYGKFIVGDETAKVTVMIFKEKLDQCKELNNGLPKSGEIVVVKGQRIGDAVFADIISVQDRAVMKYAELKND
jgi:DNA polymerase-3 subunit alpha